MKVELKRNVLHGVRVVQAGNVIDVTNELAQELINSGLATAAAKVNEVPEAEVVATKVQGEQAQKSATKSKASK